MRICSDMQETLHVAPEKTDFSPTIGYGGF